MKATKETSSDAEQANDTKSGDNWTKASDNFKKSIDTHQNIWRGLTMAYLEEVRLTANLFTNFMEKVVSEDPKDATDNPTEFIKKTTQNVLDGLSDMYRDSLNIPEKTIDKFYESYKGTAQA